MVINTVVPRLARFIHSLAQFLTSLNAYKFSYLGQLQHAVKPTQHERGAHVYRNA